MATQEQTPPGSSLGGQKELDPQHISRQDSMAYDDVEKQGLSEANDEKNTTHVDPNIVDWDGPDDPSNPRNWTTKAKVTNTSLVIVLCFLTPLASSMFAPGVPDVLREFQTSAATIAELVVSIYILGFAVGPLIISPCSEMYGRHPVYVVCNIFFIIFTIACAVASSITQLIVFRFVAGCFGVCPVTLGGASIADLVAQDKRGASMALFGMGPLLGPVIGPIAGAYLSAATDWRWTFWVITIAYGICTIAHALFCRETFSVTLLASKTKRLRKETGNNNLRSAQDDGLTTQARFSRAMIRPFKLLLFSPIVSLMAIYAAFVYGVLYLLYTTFTFVFTEYYSFTPSNVGLTYLGSGIGMFIGLFLIGGASDKMLKAKAAKNDGELKPEYRLLILMYTGWLVPCGLFVYGWTTEYRIQWAVPLFGTLLFGVGIIAALICIQQYVIDAYTLYAASATAAITVLRSIVGGLLPLAGLSLYDKLGLGWGNSLIAFIALAMTPVPFAFYFYGERIRKSRVVML
ncbi:Putative major facilitator superfamily, MFS transporter superfamily [Septoria linicola]|uniref:Cercosporin MFS transporter CTB4 n=1 Tax=Septoria linicola TaxID=215465 RepID=A0A9Q9B4V7_9PEZI|nr:putative major facilitator superfamily, MFS transporter superfamily [Septoria linicola]USW56381.1 Putative major facilitator superfamily, MFS transporter superfamily [Septoria linicola]